MAAVVSSAADGESPPPPAPSEAMRAPRARAADTGGGFLPDEGGAAEPTRAPRPRPRPAPLLDPQERPPCEGCGRGVAASYLLDTFGHPVCDECRDADGAHSLLTRTEAKAAYLLQDCDLDARGDGPLPCVRRRNPHQARGDMRLYLRAQVEARALETWGSEGGLREELARREEARERADRRREERRLRALRLEARSSLFRAPRAPHEHAFGPETYDEGADLYSRTCACGHAETYEKM